MNFILETEEVQELKKTDKTISRRNFNRIVRICNILRRWTIFGSAVTNISGDSSNGLTLGIQGGTGEGGEGLGEITFKTYGSVDNTNSIAIDFGYVVWYGNGVWKSTDAEVEITGGTENNPQFVILKFKWDSKTIEFEVSNVYLETDTQYYRRVLCSAYKDTAGNAILVRRHHIGDVTIGVAYSS